LGEVVKPLHPKTGRCLSATALLSPPARAYRDSGLVLRPFANIPTKCLPIGAWTIIEVLEWVCVRATPSETSAVKGEWKARASKGYDSCSAKQQLSGCRLLTSIALQIDCNLRMANMIISSPEHKAGRLV